MTAPAGRALNVLDGVRAFTGGIRFILSTPSVWPYAAVPVAMMGILTCGFTILGVWGASEASRRLFGEGAGWGGQVGGWFTTGLLTLAALILAVFLGLGLAQPLTGFALEKIAREQERTLTGRTSEPPSFLLALFNSLKIVAVSVGIGGCVLTVLFVIGLIFPPAAVVTVPLKIVVCGWLLAWDFLDYPLSLRGHGVRARWHWVRRNFDAFTVFGIAWTLLLIVPGIVLLLLPMGVAGATQLVIADERNSPLSPGRERGRG